MKCVDFSKIIYKFRRYPKKPRKNQSKLSVIGIDTESRPDGQCFLVCTSLGDFFDIRDFPESLFSRKYRSKVFVAYNLRYDESSFLQKLPEDNLRELRKTGKTIVNDYVYKVIPGKEFRVSKGQHSITIYDIFPFFGTSLDYAGSKYLNLRKDDIGTKYFSTAYIEYNLMNIIKYCIKDCVITQKLADLILTTFAEFGVYPTRLYSNAYVSFQYFREKTEFVDIAEIYNKCPDLIKMAFDSYSGGKFEITEKGTGYFYMYDIVSAYPYEIENLYDLKNTKVVLTNKYHKNAIYQFFECKLYIPQNVYSPCAIIHNNLCKYAGGIIKKTITKTEYEYFIENGINVEILKSYAIFSDNPKKPYKKAINELFELKKRYKQEKNEIKYHTSKIFMNSFYGKMIQLIPENEIFKAGYSFNPIHASVITANTRVKITKLQQLYPEIIAVHTDSVLSKKPLNIPISENLGDYSKECEGNGVIIGCGVYQIGSKTKLRGFQVNEDLFKLFDRHEKELIFSDVQVRSWRQILSNNWELNRINRFEDVLKRLSVSFDRKRVWLQDYEYFDEVLKRNVQSIPFYYDYNQGFVEF